jgi:acyl carrier protein
MSDKPDLLALFRQIASEVDKKSFDHVTHASVIADLGIDSLSTMQIVGELESRLGVTIADDQLVKIVTVGDLLGVVEKGMG